VGGRAPRSTAERPLRRAPRERVYMNAIVKPTGFNTPLES
jgi:hypothetical protein